MLNKFRFVHSADIHLDSALSVASLEQMPEEVRKIVSEASRETFLNLIDLCLRERADFLIISGDLFEFAERSLSSQIFVREQFEKLNQNNIKIYIVAGNHDHLNVQHGKISWPSNVVWFGGLEAEAVTVKKDDAEIAKVCGISFMRKAERDNLSFKFKGMSSPNLFNIGVLHTNLQGSAGHMNYAPCTKDDLEAHNFDYWALGHVHNRSLIKERNPAIAYPGNIQGRGFHESGEKGCYLVDVMENRIDKICFVPLDTVRFEELILDISEKSSLDELMDSIEKSLEKEDRARLNLKILKLKLKGKSLFNLNDEITEDILIEIRRRILKNFEEKVWIDSIVKTTLYNINEIDLSRGFAGAFIKQIDEAGEDNAIIGEALESLTANGNLKRYFAGFTQSEIAEILERAKSLGIELVATEDGELRT